MLAYTFTLRSLQFNFWLWKFCCCKHLIRVSMLQSCHSPYQGFKPQMLRLCGLCGFIAFNVKTGINCSNLTDSSKQMTAYLMEWDHPNQKVKFLKLYSSEQHQGYFCSNCLLLWNKKGEAVTVGMNVPDVLLYYLIVPLVSLSFTSPSVLLIFVLMAWQS